MRPRAGSRARCTRGPARRARRPRSCFGCGSSSHLGGVRRTRAVRPSRARHNRGSRQSWVPAIVGFVLPSGSPVPGRSWVPAPPAPASRRAAGPRSELRVIGPTRTNRTNRQKRRIRTTPPRVKHDPATRRAPGEPLKNLKPHIAAARQPGPGRAGCSVYRPARRAHDAALGGCQSPPHLDHFILHRSVAARTRRSGSAITSRHSSRRSHGPARYALRVRPLRAAATQRADTTIQNTVA